MAGRRELSGVLLAVLSASAAFAQGPVPQGSPIPRILPSAPPTVAPPAPGPAPAAPTAVPNASVSVRNVVVEGITAYTPEQLAPILKGLVGPETSLARIEAARVALLNRYRDEGYVLTAVTASINADGTLTFLVSEGRISEVKLDGDIGPAGTLVLKFLHHVTEKRPIDIETLDYWLLLAEEIPGVILRTVLRPSTDEPGALTLIAEVSRTPFSGLLVADNAAFDKTGPAEGLLVLDANSFTQFGEKTELSLYHTSGSTENFGQASSEFYVGASGLKLRLYAGYGPTRPSSPFSDIGYQGTTTVFGLGASYPMIRQRQQTLDLTGSLDTIESRYTTNTGPDGSALTVSDDLLHIVRFGASYALQDIVLGGNRGATNGLSLRISQGLPGLGTRSSVSSAAVRTGVSVSFWKVNAELGRTQLLFEPWDGANVALVGLLQGQWSPDVIPTVEQFYLGGLRLNPGYYSGEVTGDSALAAYTELQLNDGWNIPLLKRSWAIGAQLFGFWSWGETWNNSRLQPNEKIASAGGGIRLTLTSHIEFDLIATSRFNLNPSGVGVAPLHADALYWRVLARF